MKITIANVKFSANLGDGLLSECLEFGLGKNSDASFEIANCDLAGRTEYCVDDATSSVRNRYLTILNSTPWFLRRIVLRGGLALKCKSWRKHYDICVGDAEAIVIGGGNLLTDVDLNFPTKISLLLNLVNKKNKPVYFYGIGVGGIWSKRGLKLMRIALKESDIRAVFVRDVQSLHNFEEHFGNVVNARPVVVRDPGLIASSVYSIQQSDTHRGVGICLIGPDAISYHSAVDVTKHYLLNWYEQLCLQLMSHNISVDLFTNGGEEDVVFASEFSRYIFEKQGLHINVHSFKNPYELARYISSFDTIVAFRMHALICAYSFGSKIIAFKWDPKVESLMESLGLDCQLLDIHCDSTADVVQIIMSKLPCSAVDIRSVVEQAQDNIDDLVWSILPGSITCKQAKAHKHRDLVS